MDKVACLVPQGKSYCEKNLGIYMAKSKTLNSTKTKLRKAIYAGSFDPLTQGHIWVIETICDMFDEIVIAIGENTDKKYLFTTEQREKHILDVLKSFPKQVSHVQVKIINNTFLAKYAHENNIKYLVRGIRSANDFNYEFSMNQINRELAADVETVYLIPPQSLSQVSSSMVKSLVGPEGWEDIVKTYVPKTVLGSLKKLIK